MKMANLPSLIIGACLVTSNLVLGNPIEKGLVLKSLHGTTQPPYEGPPTRQTGAESAVTSDSRSQYRKYSWEFTEPSSYPWAGFLFTLAPKTCKLSSFCGATIVSPRTLITSCACVWTFFYRIGYDGLGAHYHMPPESSYMKDDMDLKDLPIYVFHAYYKSHWTEDILTHDWPWKLTGGKNFDYMKQNYHCWRIYVDEARYCHSSKTQREPWDSVECGISSVAVLGIAPEIRYMPDMRWPPAPIQYKNRGAQRIEFRKSSKFWVLPWTEPLFDKIGFSLTSYFMRLVDNANFVRNDIGKVVQLPESLIMMDFVLTNQSLCLGADWDLYFSWSAKLDPEPFNSEITCLMARDPFMVDAYRRVMKPAVFDLTSKPNTAGSEETWKNNKRLCGTGVGFPVWTAHGLHGMTVAPIRCENRKNIPAVVPVLPFTRGLISYIEAIEGSLAPEATFEHLQYDVVNFSYEVVKGQDDVNLNFFLKAKSSAVTHRFSIFICLFGVVLTFFKQ